MKLSQGMVFRVKEDGTLEDVTARAPAWRRYADGDMNAVEALPPVEITAAETPTTKDDVEALLKRAESFGLPFRGSAGSVDLIHDLAAALRAERERASVAEVRANEETSRRKSEEREGDTLWWEKRQARQHLRAVLDFMWPGDTGGPTVVQKARAFLAGEEQVPQQEVDRPLVALRSIFNAIGFTLGDPLKDADVARVVEEAKALRRMADSGAGYALADIANLRAQLATEDEAHAHTRAQLAEARRAAEDLHKVVGVLSVRGGKLGVCRAGSTAPVAVSDVFDALESARHSETEALAAQNRAESEAASLRIEVADLRRNVAEGETLVESLIAWAKKGRA